MLLVHQRWHVHLIDTAAHLTGSVTTVIDRLLLPCHLHRLLVRVVELRRRSSRSLIRSVHIRLVTAILLLILLTLLHMLLIAVVALLTRAIYSTVPRVLAKAHVQVEQVVACAPVTTCNV